METDLTAFGQSDPTDNRASYDWKSRYAEAKKWIRMEAIYLGALLFFFPAIMVILWLKVPMKILGLTEFEYAPILKYGFVWASGSLAGVLLDLKWLYHTVARGLWHKDRLLWRIFTPHISGGLSFFLLATVSSGLLLIFDTVATDSLPAVVSIGFLTGYFSDSALAKMSEIAQTVFGTVRAKEKQLKKQNDSNV